MKYVVRGALVTMWLVILADVFPHTANATNHYLADLDDRMADCIRQHIRPRKDKIA